MKLKTNHYLSINNQHKDNLKNPLFKKLLKLAKQIDYLNNETNKVIK